MSDHHDRPADRLADLLQLSGPRRSPAPERIEQARAAAREAWQQELQIARFAKRRRIMRLSIITLAAAAGLIIAVLVRRPADVAPVADAVTARLEAGAVLVDNGPLSRGDAIRANATVSTDAGRRATLRLGNGAELRLDADSAVRFPGGATAGTVALDRGALFVNTGSTAAERRSVEIRTAAGVARDIGTSFEVRVIGDATRVRVRDGIVQLVPLVRTGGDAAAHNAERGVELLASRTGVARRDVGTSGSEWNWIALAAPPLEVDGKTLSVFLDWVAREGGWTIRFADEALRRSASSIVLRGSIDGLTPEQALEAILPTCGLAHRIANGTVTIDRGSAR